MTGPAWTRFKTARAHMAAQLKNKGVDRVVAMQVRSIPPELVAFMKEELNTPRPGKTPPTTSLVLRRRSADARSPAATSCSLLKGSSPPEAPEAMWRKRMQYAKK